MVKQLLGLLVAVAGLAVMGAAVYIVMTSTFVAGDSGVLLRVVLPGVAGFVLILMGWAIIDGQSPDGTKSATPTTRKSKEAAGPKEQ